MYKDTRLFGIEKWYHTAPKDAYMRTPDAIRDAVCYVCVKLAGGELAGSYKPIGTAFLVGVDEFTYQFCYVVTAKHVIDQARKHGFEDIYLRLNTKEGGVDYVVITIKAEYWHGWIGGQGTVIDMVAIHLPIPNNKFQVELLPLDMFVTNRALEDHYIGPGDDIFITGLFTHHRGRQRNFPIVRSGIIAAMPDEPIIDVKTQESYYAYLIEVRSISGLSGSPVYVYLDQHRDPPPKLEEGKTRAILLLGMVRGHWELSPNDLVEEADLDADVLDMDLGFSKGEKMNVGIALVTPAHYLWDLLQHENVRSMRKRIADKIDAQESGGIAQDATPLDDGVFTSNDFDDALKLASRKISEPDQETKET